VIDGKKIIDVVKSYKKIIKNKKKEFIFIEY
jgi:hypothetical protein